MLSRPLNPKRVTFLTALGGIVVVLVVLIPTVITVVGAGEAGVVSIFGNVKDSEFDPGMHIKNPLARVIKMDVRTQDYTMTSITGEGVVRGDDAIAARAKDGASILIDITVLYRLDSQQASDVYKNIGLNYQEKVIRPAIRSVIRGVVANFTVNEVYSSKREAVESSIFELLVEDLGSRGVIIEDILLRKVSLSETLSASIEQKLAAEQEAQKYDFVLQKEKKEAERKRIEARGQKDAQQIITQSLTDKYLYYLYIQNLKENDSTIYVPINPENGLPLFRGLE